MLKGKGEPPILRVHILFMRQARMGKPGQVKGQSNKNLQASCSLRLRKFSSLDRKMFCQKPGPLRPFRDKPDECQRLPQSQRDFLFCGKRLAGFSEKKEKKGPKFTEPKFMRGFGLGVEGQRSAQKPSVAPFHGGRRWPTLSMRPSGAKVSPAQGTSTPGVQGALLATWRLRLFSAGSWCPKWRLGKWNERLPA